MDTIITINKNTIMKNSKIISVEQFAELYKGLYNYVETNSTVKNAYLNAFEKLCKKSKDGKRIAVILPTGMGKTAVANSLIARMGYPKSERILDRKVVFITPQDTISDQLNNWLMINGLDKTVIVMTYSALTAKLKRGDIEFFENIELIIVDEAHRTGAHGWERDLKKVLNTYPKINLFGITATERRYLDGARDMTQEWGMEVVYHMTIEDAWNNKLMKAPTYIIVDEDAEKHITEELINNPILNNPDNTKSGEAKRKVEAILSGLKNKNNGVSEIFRKYLFEKKINKLVMFHNTISESDRAQETMLKYLTEAGYKEIHFFIANSSKGQQEAREITRKFNKTNNTDALWVLMSINMHNEGLHIEGVYAEIQYRHTFSRNIFLQQIGRVMSPDYKNPKPLVIDFVNNFMDSATVMEPSYLDEILSLTRKPEDFTEDEVKELSKKGLVPEDFCLTLVATEITEFNTIMNNLRKELNQEISENSLSRAMRVLQNYKNSGNLMEALKVTE